MSLEEKIGTKVDWNLQVKYHYMVKEKVNGWDMDIGTSFFNVYKAVTVFDIGPWGA